MAVRGITAADVLMVLPDGERIVEYLHVQRQLITACAFANGVGGILLIGATDHGLPRVSMGVG